MLIVSSPLFFFLVLLATYCKFQGTNDILIIKLLRSYIYFCNRPFCFIHVFLILNLPIYVNC